MRLFVAVWPPGDVLDDVAALPRPELDGVRWTTRDQWHVTLRFLGSCDPDAVRERWGPVGAVPAVEARLGPAVGRFGDRVLHVPVAGLEGVAREVTAATGAVGEPPDGRPFRGHLTLARVRGPRRSGVRLAGVELLGRPVQARWVVDEVTLVASHTARDGARYEVVDRLALRR